MRRIILVSTLLVTFVSATSVASATTAPTSAVAFANLVRAGIEGTFSATYQMGGLVGEPFGGPSPFPSGSDPYNEAIVRVAQASPPGESAWLGGPGDWSYTLNARDGEFYQWVRKGRLVENCARGGAYKSLHCSGPTNVEHIGGNGYGIAIGPFVPGYAYGEIESELAAHHGPIVMTRRGSDWCVALDSTWCVDASGRLASFSAPAGDAGPILFLWTSGIRLSNSSTTSPSDFELAAWPSEPFLLAP